MVMFSSMERYPKTVDFSVVGSCDDGDRIVDCKYMSRCWPEPFALGRFCALDSSRPSSSAERFFPLAVAALLPLLAVLGSSAEIVSSVASSLGAGGTTPVARNSLMIDSRYESLCSSVLTYPLGGPRFFTVRLKVHGTSRNLQFSQMREPVRSRHLDLDLEPVKDDQNWVFRLQSSMRRFRRAKALGALTVVAGASNFLGGAGVSPILQRPRYLDACIGHLLPNLILTKARSGDSNQRV